MKFELNETFSIFPQITDFVLAWFLMVRVISVFRRVTTDFSWKTLMETKMLTFLEMHVNYNVYFPSMAKQKSLYVINCAQSVKKRK